MCANIYIYICIRMSVYVDILIHIKIRIHTCTCIHIHIYAYTPIHLHAHTNLCTCIEALAVSINWGFFSWVSLYRIGAETCCAGLSSMNLVPATKPSQTSSRHHNFKPSPFRKTMSCMGYSTTSLYTTPP